MARIVDNRITVEFDGVSDMLIDLSDDGSDIFFEQDDATVSVPRAELEQFISILRNWNAEHPRFSEVA
jgi:hypothetical protein